MNMSFMLGIISRNERISTVEFMSDTNSFIRIWSSMCILSFCTADGSSSSASSSENPFPVSCVASAVRSPMNSTSKMLVPCSRRICSRLPERMLCDLLISVMWSHISSTDAMLWVENITVAPLSRRASISSLRRFALIGSKPLNGSSKMSSSGSCSTVTMN